MTAVTDLASPADTGGPLSERGPRAVRSGPPEGDSAAVARPVSSAASATVTTVADTGGPVVPAARTAGQIRSAPADLAATPRTASRHLSPQAGAAEHVGRRPGSGQGSPVSAMLATAATESAVFAYVDGLDGAERKVLLNQIATAWPEVVTAGVELVAQWRAECAERRRVATRRKDHDRRRRQRAASRDGS